jgi:hypothetical protein
MKGAMKIPGRNVKRTAIFVILLWLAAGVFAWGAEAAHNAKKAKYNKNALPPGWRYEAGYTLWRARRNLAANRASYRKYRREKEWLRKRKAGRRAEEIAADTLDWTADEIEKLWEEYGDLLKFHPSGVTDERFGD